MAAHQQFAAQARSLGSKKREEAAAKAAATRARKKGAIAEEGRVGDEGTNGANPVAASDDHVQMNIDEGHTSATVTREGLLLGHTNS